MQPSQQHGIGAPCVKVVEWGLGYRGLRMVATFWAGIRVEVTQEARVVSRCRRAAIGTTFYLPHTTRRETVGVFYPAHRDGVGGG